jgi:hypothetical protein
LLREFRGFSIVRFGIGQRSADLDPLETSKGRNRAERGVLAESLP